MTGSSTQPLQPEWKARLGLLNRRAPELYETADTVVDVPHALAIRDALDHLGLSAIFCVQGVPTVAIHVAERYDREQVIGLHGALWNQGLASLLLVIAEDILRAFSLGRMPFEDDGDAFDQRFLIETLHTSADALHFRNLLYGAESGRLWKEYGDFFRPKERIDQVLLDNLKETHHLLCNEHLSSDAAQALIIQAMFIAYLEDRDIVTAAYFRKVSDNQADSFLSLLAMRSVPLLESLFVSLRQVFNGDLFVAPCSFEPQGDTPKLGAEHLELLERFRSGREEMGIGGQQRFWGYDFRYIPIELVSAVYDRFLGEKEEERRQQGAYFTPMFLADTVVSQVWETISGKVKERGHYLDPACGSGVFLVRSFQRLCEHWRATRHSRTIRWDSLLLILQRIHGWDLNGSAVRVAVFSLYVAVLEEVSPPDIQRLIKQGRMLPELWGKSLVCRDFFSAPEDNETFDVILGNPPWSSRRGSDRSSAEWSKKHNYPMPSKEIAWAFAWKASHHLTKNGLVSLLLPAMGFLHNHAANTVAARSRFFRENRVLRIINFADLRFQLFEHAHRPTALIVYRNMSENEGAYRFDYWAPKADLNLRIKRLISLSSADKLSLSATTVMDNQLEFKQRLWMREPDAKLFAYLSRLPKLGELIKEFGNLRRQKQDISGKWVIGHGYKPSHGAGETDYQDSDYVGRLPNLPIGAFRRLAQPVSDLSPWRSSQVHRKGFEAGFEDGRILVPRGVKTSQNRLRATYVNKPLTFQDIIQAITVPPGEAKRAKVITALLNSRVAIWYAFHGTASYGSDRPEVQQAELLKLPFPSPEDLPDKAKAEKAAQALVDLVEAAERQANQTFALDEDESDVLEEIDRLSYEYFCLSEDEIVLIDDTAEFILPAVQPREGANPTLWGAPGPSQRRDYADALTRSLKNWFHEGGVVSAHLEASSGDLGILCLSLNREEAPYSERTDSSITEALERIAGHIHLPLDGNFQLMPDFRVFIGQNLYLIKPMQLRFWLRSTGLADADAIAMDLQDASEIGQRRSQA